MHFPIRNRIESRPLRVAELVLKNAESLRSAIGYCHGNCEQAQAVERAIRRARRRFREHVAYGDVVQFRHVARMRGDIPARWLG